MKVLYFSMACNEQTWNSIQQKSKVKGSIAPLVFDRLMLKGLFFQEDVKIDVFSFPSVPTYPDSKKFAWGLKLDEISNGLYTRWLPAINLPVIKYFCFFFSTFSLLFLWLISNHKDKMKQIVVYSQFLPVALPIVILAKLSNTPCTCIITDIPTHLYHNYKFNSPVIKFLIAPYVKLTEIIQGKFDKFVFLTCHMNSLINIENKPYVIIEAICDILPSENVSMNRQTSNKSIMYAGGINEKFGIPLLLKVFSELKQDVELWLFGSGDYSDEVQRFSEINPKVKFFGRVERDVVLDYEKKASLLINFRNPNDSFTKFSFPSKTVEYMRSGTPLLTTKLLGIPDEYFAYLYTVDFYQKEILTQKISDILSLSKIVLEGFGARAKSFVETNKNYLIQGRKLFELLNI